MTSSQAIPAVKSADLRDDWRMYTAPMKPKTISNGPNRLAGRRRRQYRPTAVGPRITSAFCTASQPGWARKWAFTVSENVAAAAAAAAAETVSAHQATWARAGWRDARTADDFADKRGRSTAD